MPWFETAEDATHNAIQHSDMKPKEVAYQMRPDLKPDSAYAWLKNCLNATQPEKMTADQHIAIAKLCYQYDFLHYVAAQLHHSKPEYITPEDAVQSLEEKIAEQQEVIIGLLNARNKLKSVA